MPNRYLISLASAGMLAGMLILLLWRRHRAQCQPSVSSRLSLSTRQLMQQAELEAVSLGHSYLGTEHFLLGMLQSDTGAKEPLASLLGVDHEGVRAALLALAEQGSGPLALTPRAKRVLHRAEEVAAEYGHEQIISCSLCFWTKTIWERVSSSNLESRCSLCSNGCENAQPGADKQADGTTQERTPSVADTLLAHEE